ncbi:MAG TPA: AmmeMemoRadiSam system protein B [Terriglobia bacterium]|nr:AmmeMemoRadiSam system protein B [Terriglobia bacterium]
MRILPRLRPDLDLMPSPSPEHPGLLLRDPFRYSEAMLVIPPALLPVLACLDGKRTDQEVRALLSSQWGARVPDGLLAHLVGTLQAHGFLETEEFYRLRDARHEQFRNLAERPAAHAGSAYPSSPEELRRELDNYFRFQKPPEAEGEIIGLAAPHVSPFGGWRSYAAAYAQLAATDDRTYVVLGTSHYGQPERFGLTRKPFVTPYGALSVDTALVDWIEARAGEAVVMEDYCHSIEHSIEFQCLFLQHVLGPPVRILPILCGPFLESLLTGRPPESNPAVRRMFDTLAELAELQGSRLFWVLGVDLAHIGRRYGDSFAAQAGQERMEAVRRRDAERLEQYCRGDAGAFFDLLAPNQDDLRWCGYAPMYTFLKAVPAARGRLLHYEQWNIDEQSVVSCAALSFRHPRSGGSC